MNAQTETPMRAVLWSVGADDDRDQWVSSVAAVTLDGAADELAECFGGDSFDYYVSWLHPEAPGRQDRLSA